MSPDTPPAIPTLSLEMPAARRRRWWWIVLLLLVVAGGAVLLVRHFTRSDSEAEDLTTYTVERGDLHITVTESGTLRAKQSQRLWADIQGRAKVAWLIDEGVQVDSGDVLVMMETEELEKQIADAKIQLEQATAARIQASEKLDIQARQNNSDTEAATVKLNIAELELDRYQKGEIPRLRREARLKCDKGTVDLQLAEEDLVGMDEYVAKGYFTKKDHEQRKLALREAKDALETANQELTLLEAYQIPKDLAQKQSDVQQARTSLDLAERKAKSELAQKEADLQQKEFVESLRMDRLKDLEDRLRKMVIRAPSPGVVIYGDDRRWYSRRDIQVGMDVWRGRVILTLPDPTEMEVVLSVTEVQLDKVQEGQTATIILDAYPALTFRGRVTSVGKLAERQSRWRGSDVRTFEVIAAIDMAHAKTVLEQAPDRGGNGNGNGWTSGRLRPGMSAKIEIDVAALANILYAPIDAVFEEGGEHGVFRVEDGQPVWRPVEIGLNNRTHVHIKSGLAEGDEVLRYNPTLATQRRKAREEADRKRRRTATTQPTSRPATRPAQRDGGRDRSGGRERSGGRGGRSGRP